MKSLARIKYPLKALENILNMIIDQVNQIQPVNGTGIVITTQSPNGSVISLGTSSKNAQGQAAAATTGFPPDGWTVRSIDVMDSSCVRSTIQVLVKSP